MTKSTRVNWGRWRHIGTWVVGLPIIGTLATAVFFNPINFFSGLRALPVEVHKTSDQFSRWYHDDAAWTGHWTNNPQAYVDAADMNLSKEDMDLDIVANNGDLEGTISTKEICAATPIYDFFLIHGHVSGSKIATMIVWDTFQGHDADVAKLELRRDGVVMTVVPKEGTVRLFPKEAQLALDPNPPGRIEAARGEFCEGKREAVAQALSEIAKDASAKSGER